MSALSNIVVQALLEYNRALYIGHVYGTCTHPLETITEIAQSHERLSWLGQLAQEAVLTLSSARQLYLNGEAYFSYKKGKDLAKQCDLVSDEILEILEENLPSAAVSYQRELCERYRSIMKMSLVEVSVYLYRIQHGEDFIVCLRKLAFETLFHSHAASIQSALYEVEILHRSFMDAKSEVDVSIKDKILRQQRVENAKADILKHLRELGL